MSDKKETNDKITKTQVLQIILLAAASVIYFLVVW